MQYEYVILFEATMTVRTTLSFTDRHHRFLARKVEEGVFASASAAVAAAVEQMIEDEAVRGASLEAMAEEDPRAPDDASREVPRP